MAQIEISANNALLKTDSEYSASKNDFDTIVLDDLSNNLDSSEKQKKISLENNHKIMQAMFINLKFPQAITPQILQITTKEVASEIFIDYVVKKNLDTMTAPLAKNILSPQQIVNLGFDKEYQNFNLKNVKSFLSLLVGTHFVDEDDAEALKDENNLTDAFTNKKNTFISNSLIKKELGASHENNGLSNHHMPFGGQAKEQTHQLPTPKEDNATLGISTHDLSKKCLDFIKNQGHKKYYDDIYSRFHKDDIIKTAYILDDPKLYDYLIQTGQATADEIKKLPVLGQNKTVVTAHYNTLITPEFMCEFLNNQKLINVHIYDNFLAIFKDRPWFHSGGMQLLMQIIGGDIITAQEVSFFMDWYETHIQEFTTLFDLFDIEADYSLIRPNETDNMRSKQITSDSVKAFYFSGALETLKSANDPLLEDFFEVDLNKIVENGFYRGFSYSDYLLLRGFDISKINVKNAPKSTLYGSQSETQIDTGYLLNTIM